MANKRGTFVETEFVTISLTNDQKQEYIAWASENSLRMFALYGDLCAVGHKVGTTWDGNNNCFIISVTCKIEKDVNENCCLTARSDDLQDALMLALFKASVIGAGKQWSKLGTKANWG